MGPKASSFSSSPRTLVALLQHHRQLPLGQDDVVVDVVHLAPRHLGVVGQHLVGRGHAVHVDVAGGRRLRCHGVDRPALEYPAEIELGITTVPISQSTMAASRAGPPWCT